MSKSFVRERLMPTKVGQRLKVPLRSLVERLGYDLVPLDRDESRVLVMALQRQAVDLVVDVGANQGQYAQRLRVLGYEGRITSLEPGHAAFQLLQAHSQQDSGWNVLRVAAGAKAGEAELYVSRNSVSSSLLTPSELHLHGSPSSITASRESVAVAPLDALPLEAEHLMLKIDAQGYEAEVLAGAEATLERCVLLQVELSLRPLYADQADYVSVLSRIRELGFKVLNVVPGFRDPADGGLLQCDVLAERQSR